MATGPRYLVAFRRRREGRTDYYQRTKLVVADAPRMVVRRSNRHIIVQLVIAEMDGDKTHRIGQLCRARKIQVHRGNSKYARSVPDRTALCRKGKEGRAGPRDSRYRACPGNPREHGSLPHSRAQSMQASRSHTARVSFPQRNDSRGSTSLPTTRRPAILSRMSSRWQPP